MVSVPDAGVVFAGDLVEHDGATGSFSAESFGPETHLVNWHNSLAKILGIAPGTVICGHGEPVDRDFVFSARDQLAELVRLRALVRCGDCGVAEAIGFSSLPEDVVRAVLTTTD